MSALNFVITKQRVLSESAELVITSLPLRLGKEAFYWLSLNFTSKKLSDKKVNKTLLSEKH